MLQHAALEGYFSSYFNRRSTP